MIMCVCVLLNHYSSCLVNWLVSETQMSEYQCFTCTNNWLHASSYHTILWSHMQRKIGTFMFQTLVVTNGPSWPPLNLLHFIPQYFANRILWQIDSSVENTLVVGYSVQENWARIKAIGRSSFGELVVNCQICHQSLMLYYTIIY